MKSFAPWIFVLLLILQALHRFGSGEQLVQRPDPRMSVALAALPPALALSGPPAGLVEVMGGGSFNELQLRYLLGASNTRSTVFSVNLFGVANVTSSAMGIDRQHHFVNAYLEGYSPFKATNVFVPLQVLAQRKQYMLDKMNNGSDEIWQSSRQAFFFPRGDCEDHAIALADWLIDMGEDARVVAGTYKGSGHAWVVLIKDGQEFILEATQKNGLSSLRRYPLASTLPTYKPRFQFNRDTYWFYTGHPATGSYRSALWQKKSRYQRLS